MNHIYPQYARSAIDKIYYTVTQDKQTQSQKNTQNTITKITIKKKINTI